MSASGPATPADLRSAFEDAPIGIAVLAPVGGTIRTCNAELSRLLGRPASWLLGRTLFDVTHPEDVAGARASGDRLREGPDRVAHHECRFVHADGTTLWVQVSSALVPGGADPTHIVLHVLDVTARKELESELRHRAHHDPLTGLANRALLLERARTALAASARTGAPVSLAYVDLDGFKEVNDGHGHGAGDAVLRELAGRLRSLVGPDDTAARLAGDEFVVLLADADEAGAAALADRVRGAAAAPFEVDGGAQVVLSAAVGTATVVHPGTAAGLEPDVDATVDLATSLLRRADLRMYERKRDGR